jgi:transcription initiation factor IIE alpha subunit
MDLLDQRSAIREDLGLLAVMDALVDEEQVTQRELSRRTGLNLKKVNYCLHKLLEKGHIKFHNIVTNPNKRSYLYIRVVAG